ncbi:uracil-DNA glycosylase [Pseudoduganella rhizocola]|uniref:uracil-DNA glycosylase n=1 Tax=Pseudoduganella rhizocola TaxID=3382643 RepID=UPI0038B455B1
MSQLSPRSAVFLDEMGIGTRWVLRGRTESAEPEMSAAAHDAVAAPELHGHAPASGASANAAVQARNTAGDAPNPASVAPPAPEALPARDAAQRAANAPAQASGAPPAHAPAPAARAPAPAPAPAPADAESTAWFDDVPVPARPAAAPPGLRPAARSAPAPAEDDNSWFDDMPSAPAPVRARRESAMPAVSDEEIAAMDWPTLQAAVKSCTRCNLCRTRVAAVPGRGDTQASWIMLATMPTAEDESAIEPVAGDPGILLDNMLRALDQSTAQGAYVTNLVKCRPSNDDGSERLPTGDELAACRPYLDRELQLARSRVLVTIGQTAAKGLLGSAARGAIRSYNDVPVVATYHPSDLLRKPEDKGKAWSDLCLAKAAHAGRR